MTPQQALRILERSLQNQASTSQEEREEALSVLWEHVLRGACR